MASTDRSHRSGCAEAQEPPRPAWSWRAGTRVCAGDAEQVCDCQPTQRGCTTLVTAKIKASMEEVQLHVCFALMPLDTVEGVPGEPIFLQSCLNFDSLNLEIYISKTLSPIIHLINLVEYRLK